MIGDRETIFMNSIQSIEIPVVIVHYGNSPNYLKLALKSAFKLNSKVMLIGDKYNKNTWKNHWDGTGLKSQKYQDFLENYIQMSPYNSRWKRWFLLEEWMKIAKVEKIFLLDSDLVSFANYSQEVLPVLPNNCISALMIPKCQDDFDWVASPHCSYWTIDGLKEFTNFCIESYRDETILKKLEAKYNWHIKNRKPGGVCEMTLLYLWSKKNSQVLNLAEGINNSTIDHNINTSDNYLENEYKMRFGLKSFKFKNARPYGYNQILQKEIRFLCIHCQGIAKGVMRCLYNNNLRNFYYIGKLGAVIEFKIKSFIKKLIKRK